MEVNLVLLRKDGSHKFFPLPSSVTVIGRRHSCDLCIPLASVSRKHCQLNHDDGVLKVRDLGSHNGTYLNDKRIKEAVIQPGDSIKIGPLTFLLQIDEQPEKTAKIESAVQNPTPQNTTAEDTADEQSDSFPELDDLDLLEETGSV